mmetsp:Transcript_10737/g.16349  ORF Transcript_10737/g.16349 Transcript_10737/m.16349 type:complete len:371 (-) Transcript_10737:147-1259(-)
MPLSNSSVTPSARQKNFNVLGSTFLYDPNVTARYYEFPSPMDQTTPLEILISITQIYALVTCSIAGSKMIYSSVKKLHLISRLVSLQVERDDAKKEKNEVVARRIVTESLLQESDAAIRSFFVGVCVFAIGISFVWLSANSYHITSTDWIGGVAALIHALTVAEIALFALLCYMVKDARDAMRKSNEMKKFAANLSTSKGFSEVDGLTVEEYGWLSADDDDDTSSPLFWTKGDVSSSVTADAKVLTKAEEAVATKLEKLAKSVDPQVAESLLVKSEVSRFEGLREYVYLVLNFFAFYGYAACILVYYFQKEEEQHSFMRSILLHLPNADADWLGNAVGDFMWTVEPIVILGSPLIAQSITKDAKKKEKVA